MNEKINLNPDLDLASSRWVNLEDVTKLVNGRISPKFNGSDAAGVLRAMKISRLERIQHSVADLRTVVRIQRKNKHPHSTKKHK
jgi:hypothetical protein